MRQYKKAFTILELLVVVAIMAVLSVVATPNFIGAIEKSKESQYLSEINSVEKAAHMFYIDKGFYPTLQGDQPAIGDPRNLKFSGNESGAGLYPQYLNQLPHFSYWYIDSEGAVYHTQEPVETINSTLATDESKPYRLKSNGYKEVYPVINTDVFEKV